jgi:hypothetical protein
VRGSGVCTAVNGIVPLTGRGARTWFCIRNTLYLLPHAARRIGRTADNQRPDICCMCLLRGPNGHIRAIYPASRQSVSSWRPKLPSSSLDAHWPPLEAWYLDCIRIASHTSVNPLTCEEAEGEGECRMLLLLRSRVRPLWLLPSAPPPSHSPPLDANQLSQPHSSVARA